MTAFISILSRPGLAMLWAYPVNYFFFFNPVQIIPGGGYHVERVDAHPICRGHS